MPEPHPTNWDAVRASLKLPDKDRFVGFIGMNLPDTEIKGELEWAASQLNQLDEFGIDARDPRAQEITQLMDQIAERAGLARVVPTFNSGGLEIGGTMRAEDDRVLTEKLDRIRLRLGHIYALMNHPQGVPAIERLHADLLARIDQIKLSEKKEREQAARETRITAHIARRKVTRAEAEAALDRVPFAGINLKRARELGLVREHVPAYPEAQKIIERIMDRKRADTIDMTTENGRIICAALWKQAAPHVPRPSDGYLQYLQRGKIIPNIDVAHRRIALHPEFGRERDVWIDDWAEVDSYASIDGTLINFVLQQPTVSPLLKALHISYGSVVNVSRTTIDRRLWRRGSAGRVKTPLHQEVIENLGLDSNNYFFRCIPHDTYARLAQVKKWGQSALDTHFDGYFKGDYMCGLFGGKRAYGGASYVSSRHRDRLDDALAVRLVLECNMDLE